MSKYAELYRDFFQTIGRPLTAKDGISPELWQSSEVAVPAAIAQFYEVAGNATDFTQVYDRFLPPEQWQQEEPMSAIVEENQGVMLWGYRHADQHLEDPEVYETYPEDRDWKSIGVPWSEYILLTLCMQDYNSYQGTMPFRDTALLEDGMAEQIALSWRKVGQMSDEYHAYIRPNCFLCHLPYEGEERVFIGAQSAQLIEEIGQEFGFEWEGEDFF